MSAPAVVIRVELEASAPATYVDCVNEAEFRRLVDWLDGHPELHALLHQVYELQEARAA